MEDFYRLRLAALNSFDLPVVRFDRNGLMTYSNFAAERLLGTGADKNVTLRTLFREPDHYREVIRQLSLRMRGEASAYEASFHRPGSNDDDEAIPVRIYAFPETDGFGNVEGSLALMRDLREEQVCQRIHHAIETVSDNQSLLEALAKEVAKLIPFDEFRITTINAGRTHLRPLYSTGIRGRRQYSYRWWPMAPFVRETLAGYAAGIIDIDHLLEDTDYRLLLEKDPYLRNHRLSGVKQTQMLPIQHDNKTVAFVALDSTIDGHFNDETVAKLGRLPIVEAVMTAIHREESTLRTTTLDIIHNMNSMAADVRLAAKELVTRLACDFGWDHVSIFQIEDDPVCVRLVCQADSSHQYIPDGACLDPGDSGAALIQISASAHPICHPNTRGHSPFAQAEGFDLHGSQLIVPIRGRGIVWALNIECSLDEAFSEEEILLIEKIAHEAGAVLHRSALFELQGAVLGTINDAVIETGCNGTIRWYNAAAHRILQVGALGERQTIAQLLTSEEDADEIQSAAFFSRRELALRARNGGSVPVLMSCATLPAHLGGKVYVASDYTYQRELLRQGALKEVFRHAAMEGRIPLSLAATWLDGCNPIDVTMRKTLTRVLDQLARADLPLERLLRLSSSPPEINCDLNADVGRAVEITLREFPESQAAEIETCTACTSLTVAGDFNHIQFCIESMLAFGLRTKPQSRKLQLTTSSENGKVIVRVHGAWKPESGIDSQAYSHDRWRRKSLFDLTLGEPVIQHVAVRAGGKFNADFNEQLNMTLELPLLY